MPLVTCPDCGNNISDRAAHCIHCGAPMRSQLEQGRSKNRFSVEKMMVALIVVLLLVIFWKLTKFYPPDFLEETETIRKASINERIRSYEGGSYAQSLMESENPNLDVAEKELYALMLERQLMVNRSAPYMLNPRLSLEDIKYRHPTRTMEFNYRVAENLKIDDDVRLDQRLQNRYCHEEELAIYRVENVSIVWNYWDRHGNRVHTYHSRPCTR